MGIRIDSLYGVAMRLGKMNSLLTQCVHRDEGQARHGAGGTVSQLSRHWSCQHPLGKWMLGTGSRVGRPLPRACGWGGDKRSSRAPPSNPEPLPSHRGSNTCAQPSSGHRTEKGQSSSQFPRRAVLKNVQTTEQLHSSPMLVRSFMLGFSMM